MLEIFSYLTIITLTLLTVSAIIFIDVFDVLKLKDSETNIDDIKIEKVILPYKEKIL